MPNVPVGSPEYVRQIVKDLEKDIQAVESPTPSPLPESLLPLRLQSYDDGYAYVVATNGCLVAHIGGDDTWPLPLELAELIVCSVNAHAELVTALRLIQSQCSGHQDEFSQRVWNLAQAALLIAEAS